MKRLFALFGLVFSFGFMLACAPAFAQGTAGNAGTPDLDFLGQVMQFISNYGGMPTMLKVSGGILLIIALLKTSFIAPMWAKAPDLVKTIVAPLLGLAGALISQGSSLTWASAFAFATAGMGAVFLHEILDGVKTIPGLGAIYVTIIGLIEAALFKPVTMRLAAKQAQANPALSVKA